MGQPPADIWEGVNGKVQMRSMNFRTVNMYRMATMYMMQKSNPKLLKPKKKRIPPQEAAIKEEPKPEPEKVPKE